MYIYNIYVPLLLKYTYINGIVCATCTYIHVWDSIFHFLNIKGYLQNSVEGFVVQQFAQLLLHNLQIG